MVPEPCPDSIRELECRDPRPVLDQLHQATSTDLVGLMGPAGWLGLCGTLVGR